MAEPHVITGLIAKRAELAGKIDHAHTILRQLIIDLDNLDATIRIFSPDIDLEEIKPKPFPPRHAAYRGEIARVVLSTLRTSQKPLTTHDLAMYVMAEKGMNAADPRLVKTVGKRVGACLRNLRANGRVRSERGAGSRVVWGIPRG